MDILLAHGYFLYDDPHELNIMRPYPPLGLLYISAYLKQQGFDVGVFDATFDSLAGFEERLMAEQPSAVGIYTNMMTKQSVLKMMAICKRHDVLVILGGPEPPHYAQEYLQHGADIVVKGEGELTLEELLPHLARYGLSQLENISGIAYLNTDGAVVENPARVFVKNLSEMPWPDRQAIDIPEYMRIWKENHGQSSISLICARGCPYTCTWCSHSVFGESHRRRSPEDVAEEVLWIKETYDPDLLWYADDVFTINLRWFYQYHEELKKRNLCIPFECISRADRLNEDVIRTLADMGCYRLWNGSESGSQRVIDFMKRKVDVAEVRSVTHLLQQYGIEAGMFIMLGYDGEQQSDLKETVEHLKEANPDVFLTTVAYPIKGTAYYNEVEDRIRTDIPWAERTDRDLKIAGRHSRRYYDFATRWMVNEVALHRARRNGGVSLSRQLKMQANVTVGKIGMRLTQHQVEATL